MSERELHPGLLGAVFARMGGEALARSHMALTPIALAIEKQAKINASTGAHRFRTPTPAYPGSGPARISGTLVRSITHTPLIAMLGGWETKVGTATGLYPTYRTRRGSYTSKTPSSKYGYYLETRVDRRRGKYPFLGPAFTFVVNGPARLVYDRVYGASGWLRLL